MQARHVILRVLLEKCPGLVTVERTTGADGKPDALIMLDRSKVEVEGKRAIGDFLQKLQVWFVCVCMRMCVYVCIEVLASHSS